MQQYQGTSPSRGAALTGKVRLLRPEVSSFRTRQVLQAGVPACQLGPSAQDLGAETIPGSPPRCEIPLGNVLVWCCLLHICICNAQCSTAEPAGQACPPMVDGSPTSPSTAHHVFVMGWEGSGIQMAAPALCVHPQAPRQRWSCHRAWGMTQGHAGNWGGCAGGRGQHLDPTRASLKQRLNPSLPGAG